MGKSDDPLNVQDADTRRCMPQVRGAARDAILYARWVLSIELNSATDNPLTFFDDGTGDVTVLSGGNFHGEPIAIAMDYLALTELGNISERRLTRLTDECSNQETLPRFLVRHSGLDSGLMLTQYILTSRRCVAWWRVGPWGRHHKQCLASHKSATRLKVW